MKNFGDELSLTLLKLGGRLNANYQAGDKVFLNIEGWGDIEIEIKSREKEATDSSHLCLISEDRKL